MFCVHVLCDLWSRDTGEIWPHGLLGPVEPHIQLEKSQAGRFKPCAELPRLSDGRTAHHGQLKHATPGKLQVIGARSHGQAPGSEPVCVTHHLSSHWPINGPGT